MEVTIRVRKEVAQFALLMEQKLKEKDAERGARGWKGMNPGDELADMGLAQSAKLFVVLQDWPMSGKDLLADKVADVANLAMMIADNAGVLPPLPKKK